MESAAAVLCVLATLAGGAAAQGPAPKLTLLHELSMTGGESHSLHHSDRGLGLVPTADRAVLVHDPPPTKAR